MPQQVSVVLPIFAYHLHRKVFPADKILQMQRYKYKCRSFWKDLFLALNWKDIIINFARLPVSQGKLKEDRNTGERTKLI